MPTTDNHAGACCPSLSGHKSKPIHSNGRSVITGSGRKVRKNGVRAWFAKPGLSKGAAANGGAAYDARVRIGQDAVSSTAGGTGEDASDELEHLRKRRGTRNHVAQPICRRSGNGGAAQRVPQ